MSKNGKNKIDGPFVPLLITTIETPAWGAMSHGAKALYIALKRRGNQSNNGKIFLSLRTAAAELQSHKDHIARWYRELQYYGFIVPTQPGHLGVDGKGKATEWRLTELRHRGELPTKDFLRWNGAPFTATGKTESRPAKEGQGVPQKRGRTVPQKQDGRCEKSRKSADLSVPQKRDTSRISSHLIAVPNGGRR